jgi:predicted transcriptional regulator
MVIEENDVEVNLKNVQLFMHDRGLSEYGLSKIMNVSYSYVYRVMRGQRPPRQGFVNGLIRAGMDLNEIFLVNPLPKGNDNPPKPKAS